MKAFIPENIARHLYFYSLLFLSLSVPFQLIVFPPTIGIIVLMATWVFSLGFQKKITTFKNNKSLITIFILYIMAPVGILYTSNAPEGWNDTLVKIPILLIPIVLGTIKKLSYEKIKLLLLTFAYTTAMGALILLLNAVYLYSGDGESYHFFHHHLVDFKRVPIHYFAMYCNFSFFIILYYWVRSHHTIKRPSIYINILALTLLLLILLLTAVRIQLGAFIVTMASFIAWYYGSRKKWKQMILIFLSLFVIFSSLILSIPGSRKRLKDAYVEWKVFKGDDINKQTNHRVYLWTDGIKVIEEHFWTGTGTGAANDALYEKIKLRDDPFYDGKNYYTLARKKYNFHNAFLQHFATFGIIGFITLVLIFILPLRNLFSKEFNFLSLLFLLITFISFLTESMLERQAGNMFFGLFYGLLITNFSRPADSSGDSQ